MLHNLLTYRWALFNCLMAVALVAVAERGWLTMVFEGDKSHLSLVIAGLFLISWTQQSVRVIKTSRVINAMKVNPGSPEDGVEIMKLERDKDTNKVAWMEDAAAWLVGLGLLGTVVGFIIALTGINPDSLYSAAGVQTTVTSMMSGMRVALFTTLLGGALGMWTEVNGRMVRTALNNYHCDRMIKRLR